MPTVTIDGRAIQVKDGTSIIEAAHQSGIDVPYYCWHPKLSVAANCRMCLVEVEKAPKLQAACEVKCRDGMVIHTKTKTVLDARKSVMEFLLINHPIDCPICDQAGECKLQDYFMKHDGTGTRFSEIKVEKAKATVLGPTVILDEERCINCTRCVRFMNEVAHNPQLGQFERGDRAMIGIFPDQPLDDPYSANVADICPVGALTYRDFRFKVRSWFLTETNSVCPGCARGCSVRLDHWNNEIARIKPRDNDFVNASWMCDDGRLTYKRVHDKETQILRPHAKIGGEHQVVPWEEARRILSEMLGPFVGGRDGTLGLVLSAQISTEGATAFVELAEQVIQIDTYAVIGRPDWKGDQILRLPDQNPNRAGVELVLEAYSIFDEGAEGVLKAIEKGTVKNLIMVGTDYPNPSPRWLEALKKLNHLLVYASNWDDTARAAGLVLPLASWAEQDGTFVNAAGRIQRIHRAVEPLGGRKGAIDAALFTATAFGSKDWSIKNWQSAFNLLKQRTNMLDGVNPGAIGPLGVGLDDRS